MLAVLLVVALAVVARTAGVAGVRARGVDAGVPWGTRTARTVADRWLFAGGQGGAPDPKGPEYDENGHNPHPHPSTSNPQPSTS